MREEDNIWRDRLDGVTYGISFIVITRALLCNKLQISMMTACYIWSALLLLSTVSMYFPPIVAIVYLAIVRIAVLVMRLLLMHNCFKRLRYKRKKFVKMVIYFLYVSLNIPHDVILVADVYCAFAKCVRPNEVTSRALDISSNLIYVGVMLYLDILFIFGLIPYIVSQEGVAAVIKFERNKYHIVLQVLLLAALCVNIYHVSTAFSFAKTNSVLGGIWRYTDLLLLTILLEYGVSHKDTVKNSLPDRTMEFLQMAQVEQERASISKENILKFLHHEMRNNIQKMNHVVDMTQAALFSRDYSSLSRSTGFFQNIMGYVQCLVNDINIVADEPDISATKNVQLVNFDLSDMLEDEVLYLLETGDIKKDSWNLNVPRNCFVRSDAGKLRQLLRIVSETLVAPTSPYEISIEVDNSNFLNIRVSSPRYIDFFPVCTMKIETGEDYFRLSKTILYRIIQALGGKVISDTVELLQLVIPLERLQTQSIIDVTTRRTSDACEEVRMLVVDDASINRKLLKRILAHLLEPIPIHIDEAEDGKVALQLQRDSSCPYDIIWLDVVMPEMDGMLACQELRKAKVTSYIVMVTANEECTLPPNMGHNNYIQKPVTKEKVSAVLQRAGLLAMQLP